MRAQDGRQVIVISGKDKGKTGKILRVDPQKERVYVEGLNIVKRHQRPTAGAAQRRRSGVIEKEGPIHVSNVALVDPKDHKPTRVGVRRTEEGGRMRVTQALGHRDRLTWHDSRTATTTRSAPRWSGKFGYSSVMQAPEAGEDHAQHGRRRGQAGREDARGRRRASSPRSPARSRTSAAHASPSAKFKLREGMPVGLTVTLRGERAYEFLDRLTAIAIPRIRDFRGLNPRSFDGRGNYSMGVREQIIFPEIDYDAVDQVRGLDVTITTTAQDRCRGLRPAGGAGHAVRPRRASGRLREPSPGNPSRRNETENPWPRPHRSSASSAPAKYKTRAYTRCRRCGRPRAVYRKFGLCRICLREMAHQGFIPGMTK